MDLRQYGLHGADVLQAAQLLNYQPFILSDDLQTGIAYCWLHTSDGSKSSGPADWVCNRRIASPEHWNKFTDANSRLRTMYEDWIRVIADRVPGGSLVDVGCCSGYFPLRAQQLGMKECAGYDAGNYSVALAFLNRLLGTRVQFHHQGYDFEKHTLPGCKTYDVAVASAIMCHVPDPLHFLACLGRIARKAVFLFTSVGSESDELTIHYQPPNRFYKDRVFPYNFDDNTSLSRGLLYQSMEWMGFTEVVEMPYQESWLPRHWYGNQRAVLFLR
jgi:SAM-dependent methyltransferase